jgi:outer membrane protein TolC
MRIIVTIILLGISLNTFSQKIEEQLLSYADFLSIVKMHHPIAIQAAIQRKKGEATMLTARGNFDPKAGVDINQKYFNGKSYYDLSQVGLKVPTWFGIELETGFEQNQGVFLNPENTVPNEGLWYAGIKVPLGKGLFIDKRRAELKKAKVYLKSTEAEQQVLLNNLLYDAGKTYWKWFEAFNQLKVYEEAYQLAKQRFDAVQTSADLGDAPSIDTLESGIQVQNRELNLQQANLDFANKSAMLSVYLWQDGFIPLELLEGTHPLLRSQLRPIPVDENILTQFDTLVNKHPELRKYEFRIDKLEIEKRWKKEQLKPELNLKYNPVSESIDGDPLTNYSVNNYTWGLQFNFPIFLRKERGQINLVNLHLQETELEFELKKQSLLNKTKIALNEWRTTVNQVKLYEKTTLDYYSLLDGERQLFNSGESSLFMVNSRELGYINAQLKLIELIAKNRKAQLGTYFAIGTLPN